MGELEGLQRLGCGDVEIMWLPSQVPVLESELQRIVHPDEWLRAQAMGAKSRRLEYLRSRYLLRRMTGWRDPLPASSHGAPAWPPSWKGSISHKEGHVALAITDAKHLLGVGIDVESTTKVTTRLESRILVPDESRLLDLYHGVYERAFLLAMVFSFKESIFKCHFPLGLKMFYFHDARLEDFDLAHGVLRARMQVASSPLTPIGTLVEGHMTVREEDAQRYVLTSVILRS